LLSLPRYLGGDGLSGAYVLHSTDARSLFRLAGGRLLHYAQGIECQHADDYPSEIAFRGPERLALQVRFRTRRAYEDARRREPGEDVKGRLVQVVGAAFDDAARFVEYDVLLAPGFFRDPHNELYLYDDGRFRRVEPNQ
jgi:hypothetical protein